GCLQGRPKLVVRRDRSLGGKEVLEPSSWWSASLPRQSLEVALMALKALGNVVTTDLLRISSCRRKVDPCAGPEKLMRSSLALESLQLTKLFE
ncbi:hypothetical protein IGI04_030911, partial [Brassica rapa subsp. trilocularis]